MAPAERRGRWYALAWCLIATVTATACSRDRGITDVPVGSAPVAVAVRGDGGRPGSRREPWQHSRGTARRVVGASAE